VKHLKEYKVFESDSKESVVDDVRDILSDISDEGYNVEVGLKPEHGDDWSYNHILTVEIFSDGYDYIDMDKISDTIVRLYDYMKSHQDAYNRNPCTSRISVPATQIYYVHVGWAQFDKRYTDAYNNLLKMTEIGFRRMILQWRPKNQKTH